MAKRTDPLTVTEIFNMVSGRHADSSFYLSMGDRRVNRLRRWLNDFYNQEKKYLVCAHCHGPLYLRGGRVDCKQQLHFCHYQSEEYKTCPLNEGNASISPEQVKANQYNGVQESKRHKMLKNALGEIMEMDADCRGTEIDKFHVDRNKNERRRPDVQTKYKDISLVLEVQLSTEFITIISEREAYYRDKKTFMLWIFDSFAKNGIMNQSEKDIFYKNNSQAFCIDQQLIEKSRKSKKLHLNVIYNIPYIDDGKIKNHPNQLDVITIDDIVFDKRSTLAYYFPYDKTYQDLKVSLIHENVKKLVKKFHDTKKLETYLRKISEIASPFLFDLQDFVVYMLSAKEGRDILERGESEYISICQRFLNPETRANWLFYFYSVLKHNGHEFLPGNGKEKMKDKAKRYLRSFRENPTHKEYSKFYPQKRCEELFAFLFPSEYEKFIELITWTGIDWEKIDTSHFAKLDGYEL